MVGEVSLANAADIGEAVSLALEGFVESSKLPSYKRAESLAFISHAIQESREDFSQLITAEVGKPIAWSRAEVDRAVITFQLASEEAKRISGETIPLDISTAGEQKIGIVRRFPVGVVLCIAPFNYPLNLVAHKVAPAMAAGNAFIVKPPPQAPLTSLRLAEIILQSGYPAKAVSVLPCANEVAESLVTDERIAMLSFTGSPNVGWMLKSKAGKKKVALELGGNAGVIIDRSANIDEAVKKNVVGAFLYAGQVCIKVQRIYVHESIYDEYKRKLVDATSRVKCGDPNEPDTMLGPLIDDAAASRVKQWIDESVANGASLLVGGKKNGKVVEPTILENVRATDRVFCKEIFGPVVTLHKFSTIEEAVDQVNNSPYGLQAGIFSNDHRNILYAYERLRVGGVIVNDNPTFRVDHMPYGGIKDSGFGREGVKYAIEEMTEKKLLVLSSGT